MELVEFVVDQRFGFELPSTCEGVPSEILNPKRTWQDGVQFDAVANKLALMFQENFKQFSSGCSDAVLDSAPRVLTE